MRWIRDDANSIEGFVGYTLFEEFGGSHLMLAYIHNNGGQGSSWIVNVGGLFAGWAIDEAAARKKAEDLVAASRVFCMEKADAEKILGALRDVLNNLVQDGPLVSEDYTSVLFAIVSLRNAMNCTDDLNTWLFGERGTEAS